MQEKENIEELFKEVFQNYEEPVNPELWTKVANAIQTPTPPADLSSVAGQGATGAASTGIVSNITAYIAGALILAGTATGIYFYASNDNTANSNENNNPQNEIIIPATDEKAVVDNSVILNEDQGISSGINNEKTTASTVNLAEKKSSRFDERENVETIQSASSTTQVPSHNQKSAGTIVVQPIEKQQNANIQTINNDAIPAKPQDKTTNENLINPSLLFEANPITGIAPLVVNFKTAEGVNKAEWTFGDGSTSVEFGQLQHTYTSPGTYSVVLKHFTDNGKMINKQVTIEVKSDLEIAFVPNIFSPNGDGSNDVFTFDASHLTDYEVTLFDQSGKKIHSWKKVNGGWDGRLNSGKEAREGTYFYVIFATGENNNHNRQSGIIQLIR